MGDEKGFATILLVSAGIITLDDLAHAGIHPSSYFGLVGAFFLCSIVSSFQPDFARALAWLVFVAILFARGSSALSILGAFANRGRR